MATQAQWRTWLGQAEAERYGATAYQLRQREMKRGRRGDRARPLEFDESGFPIPQRIPGFVQRVGRLVNGD
jgi:hypothetical protein